MSGQLGDLVISLSADIARFQSDMGKAIRSTETAAKQMTTSLDAIPAMFGTIGKAAAGVTALLAGGAMFGSFISTTKEVTAEVVKLSKVFGISAEDASIMRVALDDAFLTVDDAVGASDRLTRASIKNSEAFKKVGIDIREQDGSLKDSMKVMMEVNDYLKTLKEGKDRDTAAMSLYGKGWRELSGILRLNSEGMKEAKSRAEELHLIIGQDGISATKKYKQAMKDLDDVAESFKVQVGTQLIPELTKLAVVMGDIGLVGADKTAGAIKTVREDIQKLVDDFKKPDYINAVLMIGRMLNPASIGFGRAETPEEIKKRVQNPNAWKDMSDMTMDGVPGGPGSGGNNAGDITGDLEKQAAAAKAAYDKYSNAFDSMGKQIRALNPDLTPLQKKLADITEEINKQSAEMEDSSYANSIKKKGDQLKTATTNAENLKAAMAGINAEAKELEESTKDMVGFGRMGLEPKGGFLNAGVTGKTNKLSLSGPSFTAPKWAPELSDTQAQKDELLKIEGRYNDQIMAMKMGAASQSMEMMKKVAGESKAIAIAALIGQKALAAAQIWMNTEVAASSALAAPPLGLGPIAGQALAAQIRAAGYVSMGMVAASAVMEGMDIAGQRAAGGPVSGGSTYLVGEKGPELFTPGASGMITPNSALGGQIVISQTFNAPGADAGVLEKMKIMAKQAGDRAKAEILNSMNRGGEFALASGRVR